MDLPTARDVIEAIEQGTVTRLLPELLEHAKAMPYSVISQVLLARALEVTDRPVDSLAYWRTAALLLPNSPAITEGVRRVLSGPQPGAPAAPAAPAPQKTRKHTPSFEQLDDLDNLIDQLQSARIVPNPDLESIPEVDLEDESENMVSETLARIYAAQNQYEEAARVFEQLAIQQPDRRAEFLRKADEMRARSQV